MRFPLSFALPSFHYPLLHCPELFQGPCQCHAMSTRPILSHYHVRLLHLFLTFLHLRAMLPFSTPCRAAFRYQEDGAKVRVSRGNAASASVIPRPDILLQRKTLRPAESERLLTLC